jgi:hypothetical protein
VQTLLFDKNSCHRLPKLLPTANAMEIRAKIMDSRRKRDKIEVDDEKPEVGTAPIGKYSLQVLKPFDLQPGHLILNGDRNHDYHDFVTIYVGKTRFKVRFPFVVNEV